MIAREHRHLLGAFAAMVFVGASWGANVPVSKVMLGYFDLIPMSAIRTTSGAIILALLVAMVKACVASGSTLACAASSCSA